MRKPKPSQDKDSICVRVTIGGKRHKIMGFGRYDDPQALQGAKAICETLWGDMLTGRVLNDIALYSPKAKVAAIAIIENKVPLTLKECWARFTRHKESELCGKTLQNYYNTSRHIDNLKLNECKWQPLEIKERLLTLSPYVGKKVAKHLTSMSRWAYDYEITEKDYLVRLKIGVFLPDKIPTPSPFTALERDAILEYFAGHEHYRHYENITKFMFYTGCRTCEAIGVQQKHINLERNQVILGRSVVPLSDGTQQEREVSKNGGTRVFPLNKALHEMFITMDYNGL
jgi:integrase